MLISNFTKESLYNSVSYSIYSNITNFPKHALNKQHNKLNDAIQQLLIADPSVNKILLGAYFAYAGASTLLKSNLLNRSITRLCSTKTTATNEKLSHQAALLTSIVITQGMLICGIGALEMYARLGPQSEDLCVLDLAFNLI